MKETIINVREQLLERLLSNLSEGVEAANELAETFEKHFTPYRFSMDVLRAFLQSRDLREQLLHRIKVDKAKELGIDCSYGTPEPHLSQEQKMNRAIVKTLSGEEIRRVMRFVKKNENDTNTAHFVEAIAAYVRTGAIKFGELTARAQAAEGAEDALRDFCTVSTITEAEKQFVNVIREAKKARDYILSAPDLLSENLTPSVKRIALPDFHKQLDRLKALHFTDNVYFNTDGAEGTMLIRYMAAFREKDKPRFFNNFGKGEKVDAAYIYKHTGWLMSPTPYLRYYYPQLYRGEGYKGGIDTPQTAKEFAESTKRREERSKWQVKQRPMLITELLPTVRNRAIV